MITAKDVNTVDGFLATTKYSGIEFSAGHHRDKQPVCGVSEGRKASLSAQTLHIILHCEVLFDEECDKGAKAHKSEIPMKCTRH